MIVVRDVFQIEPEKMKQAKDEIKQHRQLTAPLGYRLARVMTDLSGDLVSVHEYCFCANYSVVCGIAPEDENPVGSDAAICRDCPQYLVNVRRH